MARPVFLHAQNPLLTALVLASVAASVNQDLFSVAGAVFLLSSVAVWMKKTITLRYKSCHCCECFQFWDLCFALKILVCIYTQPGEIIFGDGCSKLCRCAGNYTFDCVDNTCDPVTEECREVGGVHGCYPKGITESHNNLLLICNYFYG